MDPRTTSPGRAANHSGRTSASRRRRTAVARRPGLLLAVAAAGAVAVDVVIGIQPPAQAGATSEPVSIADELGLTAQSGPVRATAELDPLEELVASRSSREAAETAARKSQTAADRSELEKQKAAAKAKAEKAEKAEKAKAEKAEKAKAEKAEAEQAEAEKTAAAEQAAEPTSADEPPAERAPAEPAAAEAPSGTAVSATARISNTAGSVSGGTQAAANVVVSNVPGAGSITIGGTRPSATDPAGHPSGRALDWMVLGDTGLGDAIVRYHIANWDALGVDYLIYQQRMLSSPGGSWSSMADRGSPTANHYDHVHVNYR